MSEFSKYEIQHSIDFLYTCPIVQGQVYINFCRVANKMGQVGHGISTPLDSYHHHHYNHQFSSVKFYVLQNKNEEQGKLAEEIMEQYQAANNKVKKLEMDLDAALREKVYLDIKMIEAFGNDH